MIHLINWSIRIIVLLIVILPIGICMMFAYFLLWDDRFLDTGADFIEHIFRNKN